MYSAYQSGQFGSGCPVRFSCSTCAASARRSAAASSVDEVNVVRLSPGRPGSVLLITNSVRGVANVDCQLRHGNTTRATQIFSEGSVLANISIRRQGVGDDSCLSRAKVRARVLSPLR